MDQINAHLSHCSGAIQRDWMFSGSPDGRPRPTARRPSQPINVPSQQARHVFESGFATSSINQDVSSKDQDGSVHMPPQTLVDHVLPSPAPSDDTPQIISVSSTRRQSQDQQQPRTQPTLDLNGMSEAIVPHNQFFTKHGNQAATTPTRTAVATPEKRPAECDDSSQPKRRATDLGPLTPAQSASPRAAFIDSPVVGLNWKNLTHLLDTRLLAVRAQGLETYIVSNRLRLLREACDLKDIVYLAVHQVFCVNTIMRLKNPASLPIAGHGILCQLLLKNETLDKESVEWFSTFPSSFPISPQTYLQEYNQVQIHLKFLEQNWSAFQKDAIAAKCPPLDVDMITRLRVTSPILQRILYRCICRGFWPPSPEDGCLQSCFDLFTRYQTENRYVRALQSISVDKRAQMLEKNYQAQRLECLERWQNHQNHVRDSAQRITPLQNPTSSTHPPRTLVNLAAPTNSPSNDAMHHTIPRTLVNLAAPTNVPGNETMHHIIPGSPSTTLPVSPQVHAFTTVEQRLWLSRMMQMSSQYSPSNSTNSSPLIQVANTTPPSTSGHPPNAMNSPARRRGRPPLGHSISPSNDMHSGSPLSAGANSSIATNQPRRASQQGLAPPLRTVSQPQRHNTLPSTTSQLQTQFIAQAIPLQQQQQQALHVVPSNAPQNRSRPPPASIFRSIDYSGTPLHPVTSTLHQAHLEESPITIATEGGTSEGGTSEGGNSTYLHYLDSFALPPFLVKPQDRNRTCTFTVSSQSFRKLAKPPKAYDTIQAQLRSGSQTYRLRCIHVSHPDGTHFDKTGSFWSTQDTCWPALIIVMLNDRTLEIRRKEVHGKDYYIEISDCIQEGENKLYISLLRSNRSTTKDDTTYAVAIEVLQIKSISTAREELGHLPELLTREAIFARLRSTDPDIEIVSGAMMRLSLIDPISLQINKLPVRGAGCKHFECFDLESFLSTRYDTTSPHCAKPEAFRCPICGGDARPKVLLHDDWQSGVLAKYTVAEMQRGVKSVVINEMAEWEFDVDKHDGCGKGGAKVKTEEGEVAPGEGGDREREVIVLD